MKFAKRLKIRSVNGLKCVKDKSMKRKDHVYTWSFYFVDTYVSKKTLKNEMVIDKFDYKNRKVQFYEYKR